jgi:ribosomal protein L6P/L9E
MSKIGRKPIPFSSAKIEVKGNKILVSGSKLKFEYELPAEFDIKVGAKSLVITAKEDTRESRTNWG